MAPPLTMLFLRMLVLCSLLLAAGSCRESGSDADRSAAEVPTSGVTTPAVETRTAAQRSPLAISLLGEELFPPSLDPAFQREHEAALAEARAALELAPDELGLHVRVGRELGYLGRFDEAVEVYTQALDRWPDEPHLLRHRGHRRLTLRQLGLATYDLSRAAELLDSRPDEVEPDGIPNSRSEPRSTLKGNVWYHLGLALFFSGEYSRAHSAFAEASKLARNDDSLVACLYWRTLCQWRMELDTDAEATLAETPRRPDVIENGDYLELLRLFRGERTADEVLSGDLSPLALATRGFGVAQVRLHQGDLGGANDLYVRILDDTPWPAFGHLAAEAELARL